MAIQVQPSRIPEPFAGSGTKNAIPATNSQPSASQAASWASGFPPECSQPLSAGGCPVPRDDVNGALNQISQDYAFRQDGGVWAWSALADYDVNRMVLGSDSKVYWSVAQSGPGIAAGAQDPTADTGVYWSTMPMNTPPLADDSDKTATTEWVRDLATAPVYVDPAGSDSNDGLSSASAVATFGKALQIASSMYAGSATIIAAGGTYAGNVGISNVRASITFSGNVSVTGNFSVAGASLILSASGSYSFNVSGQMTIGNSSSIYASCSSISATYLYVYSGSSAVFDCQATFSATANAAIGLSSSSFCYFSSTCTASSSGNSGVSVANCSCLYFEGNATVSSGASLDTILVSSSSALYLGIGRSLTISVASGGNGLSLNGSSSAMLRGDLTVNAPNGGSQCIFITEASSVEQGNNFVKITGAWGTVVRVLGNSYYYLNAGASTAGSTATGRRFYAEYGGQINVNGAGINRIPGDTPGSADSASYAYYG